MTSTCLRQRGGGCSFRLTATYPVQRTLQRICRITSAQTAVELELGRDEVQYFLARDGDDVASFLKIRRGRCPDAIPAAIATEVQQIYVDATFQRRGIGRLLMDHAARIAAGQGRRRCLAERLAGSGLGDQVFTWLTGSRKWGAPTSGSVGHVTTIFICGWRQDNFGNSRRARWQKQRWWSTPARK